MTTASVRALFRKLNTQYFDNLVPPCEVSVSGDYSKYHDGSCGEGGIRLSSSLKGDRLRSVLLHEMVHALHPGEGHGGHWMNEMRRLACVGAIRDRDWQRYQTENEAILTECFDGGYNGLRFRSVRVNISSLYNDNDADWPPLREMRREYARGRRAARKEREA